MTHDDLNRLAIIASARTEGDVRPEDVTSLRVEIPGAGWTERETGLPPPDEGSLVTGLLWGIPIASVLWVVLLSLLWWGMKARWW